MINTNQQIKLLWDKIIYDMDGDDIVLEIKILETNILDYRKLFIEINNSLQFPFNYSIGTEDKKLPNFIDKKDFSQELIREIKIDLGKIILFNGLRDPEEIEFFTNSVLNLRYEETITFFYFIKWLGDSLTKKVNVFIESNPYPTISYDAKNNAFSSYTYL